MKSYICVGIGDMMFLDSILTLEEKATAFSWISVRTESDTVPR